MFAKRTEKTAPAGDAPDPQIQKAITPVKKPHKALPYFVLGDEEGSVSTKKAENKMPPVKRAARISPEKYAPVIGTCEKTNTAIPYVIKKQEGRI